MMGVNIEDMLVDVVVDVEEVEEAEEEGEEDGAVVAGEEDGVVVEGEEVEGEEVLRKLLFVCNFTAKNNGILFYEGFLGSMIDRLQ